MVNTYHLRILMPPLTGGVAITVHIRNPELHPVPNLQGLPSSGQQSCKLLVVTAVYPGRQKDGSNAPSRLLTQPMKSALVSMGSDLSST